LTSSTAEQVAWKALRTLWQSRRLIIVVTGITAVGAVIISLLLPVWYMAEVRLLLPSSSEGPSLLSSLRVRMPVAASPLGGIIGDFQRHMSILGSRTVKQSTVREFDLASVYDLTDEDFPEELAMKMLSDNSEFVVDQEYNHLNVRVYDRDPQLAADIANFMANDLNRVNALLVSQNAGALREKIEQSYAAMIVDLDSVSTALRDLQARYGVMDITSQGEAFLTGISELRQALLMAQVQYGQMRELYGDNNVNVRSALRAATTLQQQYDEALAGAEAVMPISMDSLPDVSLQFWNLEIERQTLGELIVATRPVLEEARLEEQRQVEAVEILDPAVPPIEKARPARAVICIASTFSGFIASVTFVLLLGWWRENHAAIARRLSTAT